RACYAPSRGESVRRDVDQQSVDGAALEGDSAFSGCASRLHDSHRVRAGNLQLASRFDEIVPCHGAGGGAVDCRVMSAGARTIDVTSSPAILRMSKSTAEAPIAGIGTRTVVRGMG